MTSATRGCRSGRLDYGAPVNATIFVDTAAGVLADRTRDAEKPERLSFSLLHKWNFLFPLGRTWQNGIVSAALLFMAPWASGCGWRAGGRQRDSPSASASTHGMRPG